jgi:hypothetical protein
MMRSTWRRGVIRLGLSSSTARIRVDCGMEGWMVSMLAYERLRQGIQEGSGAPGGP